MSNQLSIGNELKDSFKETYKWVNTNIKWLKDIEAFYRERAKLEKEYSERLNSLTSEYFNKKNNVTVSLSVGETPTKTPGSVESATVVTWNEILKQTEQVSKDHNQLGNDFEAKICAQLNGLYTKLDMTLGKINGFNEEMENKRKISMVEVEKAKKAYDESCESMENARNKATKSGNDRNKRKLQEKEVSMNNSKNNYLIKINQANRIKDKFYFQDVPEVVDLLQDLNETRILFLNNIWLSASDVEKKFSDSITSRLTASNNVIKQDKPSLGTAMFIKHNVKSWKEPSDYQFRPSPIWHDDEAFTVPSAQELKFLKLELAKAEQQFDKLNDITQDELQKLAAFNKKKQELKSNEDTLDANEFYENLKNYLKFISSFTLHETNKLVAEVSMESIQNNVPKEMDLSTDNIDVSKLKKKGGLFSKFKKNVLNVDAGTSTSTSQNNSNRISVFSSRTRSSTTTTQTEHENQSIESNHNKNKVLYAYAKQDADEIDVTPGDVFDVIEADTGSGWTKIKNLSQGHAVGVVPTSYIEIGEPVRAKPSVPPPRRKHVRTLEVVFDYVAQGDDEISINVGDVVTVIKGDDGSGWTYGELNGLKGLVPTSYCK
ncbi:hypothetical protein KAFR_0F00750 [Kazachstania africana CBS 2517]|uniref:Protein BZZ1 n=1 Tax=Kazachstania africana (strain ATCC 22294 / BCRC 22015 / CBS 2517 / CECT 1963 / NBRC 1671 / NRRL Y-8276) TaxID=1071382 RepID=H2AWC2_KAZAF|nr:hypothetical protein KAFR_0F00750 [Kazachstania africana CBS 2517]CCF58672.1 hypothetical protein KAFR_0F00750 [Kazachstania africana CBS 2517]